MKTSIKVILITATVGVLGMAGLSKAVLAGQNRSLIAAVPRHSSMMNDKKSEIGEESDRETNNDVKDSQEASKLQPLARFSIQKVMKKVK